MVKKDKVTKASKEFEKLLKDTKEPIFPIDQDVLLNHIWCGMYLCGGRGLVFEHEGKKFQVRPIEPIKIPWSKFIVEEINAGE